MLVPSCVLCQNAVEIVMGRSRGGAQLGHGGRLTKKTFSTPDSRELLSFLRARTQVFDLVPQVKAPINWRDICPRGSSEQLTSQSSDTQLSRPQRLDFVIFFSLAGCQAQPSDSTTFSSSDHREQPRCLSCRHNLTANGARFAAQALSTSREILCDMVFGYGSGPVNKHPVLLIDVNCYKPPEEYKVNSDEVIRIWRETKMFDDESVDFFSRVLDRSGLDPISTYLPPALNPTHCGGKPRTDLAAAEWECREAVLGAAEGLLEKTGLSPRDIDIVITTCSIYCSTPSLASMLVNHFKMKSDIKSYHLGGMGCANGRLINDG
eukprot:gene15297-21382_t